MSAVITSIYRYPVKGLSPEAMSQVSLRPGEAVPGDRQFALARSGIDIDINHPNWLPKRNFLMLALNGRLAALNTRYDDASGVLDIVRHGKVVASGNLLDATGRATIEKFVAEYLGAEAGGRPRIVVGPTAHTFSDVDARVISIINLASIRDLQAAVGQPVDPLRFRANIYVDGLAPWAEFDWIGQDIRLGKALLRVTARTSRCAATAVNPDTGDRDINVVKALSADYGHIDMGVYATVVEGGSVDAGHTAAIDSD